MNEMELKLYEHFRTDKTYYFSKESSVKYTEIQTIKELESNGYITVKMLTIGYAIVEICK